MTHVHKQSLKSGVGTKVQINLSAPSVPCSDFLIASEALVFSFSLCGQFWWKNSFTFSFSHYAIRRFEINPKYCSMMCQKLEEEVLISFLISLPSRFYDLWFSLALKPSCPLPHTIVTSLFCTWFAPAPSYLSITSLFLHLSCSPCLIYANSDIGIEPYLKREYRASKKADLKIYFKNFLAWFSVDENCGYDHTC